MRKTSRGDPGGRRQRSDRLADAVYTRVKTDIFDFRLVPGARFSENEIARRGRVSRTPVREALLRLEREGYLEVNAKSGWSVRPLDFQHFEYLYDVRIILELAAVKKLCSADIGDALTSLKKTWLVAAPRQRLRDWLQVSRLDEAFHSSIVAAAGNPELARIHNGITERIRIIRRLDFTQPERIDCTYDEHAGILRAILARKAQQAALLLKSHVEQSKLEVRKISLHRLHVAHQESRTRN
ncbi:MAG TPA: GntR family transcriptional regulator [Burkholderiales bacterium]|nr:GntR family transcriptional regulator [Burkholderiales bacterium]